MSDNMELPPQFAAMFNQNLPAAKTFFKLWQQAQPPDLMKPHKSSPKYEQYHKDLRRGFHETLTTLNPLHILRHLSASK